MNEATLPLTLSGLEVVWLSDAVRNSPTPYKALDDSDEVKAIRPLILNLGSAYRELVSKDGIAEGPLEVAVTREQCWLMRALLRTGDMAIDGKTNIGAPLLLKLYGLLLEFSSELDLEVGNVKGQELSEDAKKDLKEQGYLSRWRPDETTGVS